VCVVTRVGTFFTGKEFGFFRVPNTLCHTFLYFFFECREIDFLGVFDMFLYHDRFDAV